MPRHSNTPHPKGSMMLSGIMILFALLAGLGSGNLSVQEMHDAMWIALVALLASLAIILGDGGNEQIESGSGFIPIVLAALAYGPSATLLVAVVSGIPFLFINVSRSIRRISTRVISGAAVAVLFQSFQINPNEAERFVMIGFFCALLYQAIQFFMTGVLANIEFGGDLKQRLRALWPHFGLGLLVFGPMAVAYAYLLPKAPQAVLIATFAVVASHQLLTTIQRSRSFEKILTTMSAEIPGSLLAALDAADAYTAQHSAAVASYAFDLAVTIGYEPKRARQVHAAALLHDVGKIGVPDSVLTKPGRLDDNEWLLMQKHPELGANMVKRLPGFDVLEPGIRHHHERIDGSGYPDGKNGDGIPEEAQIIAVADTYSAITTSRTYREARPPEVGVSELKKDALGGKLNPVLVEQFVTHLEKQPHTYQTGAHTHLAMEVSRVRGWLNLLEGEFPQQHTKIPVEDEKHFISNSIRQST